MSGEVITIPSLERSKELDAIKNNILNEIDGLSTKEIELLFKLIQGEVNSKSVFSIK